MHRDIEDQLTGVHASVEATTGETESDINASVQEVITTADNIKTKTSQVNDAAAEVNEALQ